MEASSSNRRRTGGGFSGAMFSTRRGALTTALVAALLAGILLFAFVQSYKKGTAAPVVNTPVFVASGYIPAGTPVSVIAAGQLIARTTVPASHVVVGAITDPSVIRGQAAAVSIYPGQQLTAADFAARSATIAAQLTGNERAIALSLDSSHGLVGIVGSGDHVDVLADVNSRTVLVAANISVLSAPGGSTGGSGGIIGGGSSSSSSATGNIVLAVTPAQAQSIATAQDNSKVWLTLLPPAGALGTTRAGK